MSNRLVKAGLGPRGLPVRVPDGDTVVAGADDLVPLFIGLGVLESGGAPPSDELWRECLALSGNAAA